MNEILFQNLTSLKILELEFNGMTRLPDRLLNGLVNLNELNLAGNRVISFSVSFFMSLASLKTLWLNQNELVTFDEQILNGLINLESVYLNYNKFNDTERERLRLKIC